MRRCGDLLLLLDIFFLVLLAQPIYYIFISCGILTRNELSYMILLQREDEQITIQIEGALLSIRRRPSSSLSCMLYVLV